MRFDWQRWTDYVQGRGTPAEREACAKELAADQGLSERVEALKAVAESGTRFAESEPPELWVARAQALMPVPKESSLWTRLLPVFDSKSQPAMGLRSGATAAREIRYALEGIAVDLRIEPSRPGTFEVIGLIASEMQPSGEYRCELRKQGKTAGQAVANAFGEFMLSGIHPGEYELVLTNLLDESKFGLFLELI